MVQSLIAHLHELRSQEMVPGFQVRFVHSQQMTFAFWEIEEGARLPEHQHPHEQVVQVLEGEFELTVNDESVVLSSGTVFAIPSNAVHSGVALTDCRVLDTFAPRRDDYVTEFSAVLIE